MAGGRPIETVMTTDVSSVISGAEKIADSYEEIQDSLKDTGKAGDKSFEQLEDSSKSASESMKDDAQAAARVIDRDLTQALKDVDAKMDSAGKSGKNIGDGVKTGADKAKGSLDELKEEANSTAREAGASFDGTAEGIAGAFQEVAANTFGPIGLAAAVGIGIAIAKMQELSEANDEAAQSAIDLAREIYDAGGALDEADLAEKIKDLAFAVVEQDNWLTPWADESLTNIERVKKAVGDNTDLAKELFESFEGDPEKIAASLGKLDDALAKDKEALKEHQIAIQNGKPIYDADGKAIEERVLHGEKLRESLEEERDKNSRANEAAQFYTEAMGESAEAADKQKEAEDKLLKVQQDRIAAEEKLSETNRSAIENEISYNQQIAETTKGIGERGKATDTLTKAGQENNTALIDLSESGASYLQGLYDQGAGADVLAAKVAGVREQFIAQAVAAGYSKEEAEKLAASYGLIPPEVTTKVSQTGAEETKAAVDAVPGEKATEVTVTESGTAETQGAIDGVDGKEVSVDVTDDGTSGQVQNRVDDLKGKDVKIDVQDFNTVSQTQDRIDRIKGRDVDINVRLANLQDIENKLATLTLPRTAYVDIVQRDGQKAP